LAIKGEGETKRAAAMARQTQPREAGQMSSAYVRLAAEGLGVTERTGSGSPSAGTGRLRFGRDAHAD